MDIFETVNYIYKEEGREEGRREGQEEGKTRTEERIIMNLIVKFGYANEQIAALADVSVEKVAAIRKKLNL